MSPFLSRLLSLSFDTVSLSFLPLFTPCTIDSIWTDRGHAGIESSDVSASSLPSSVMPKVEGSCPQSRARRRFNAIKAAGRVEKALAIMTRIFRFQRKMGAKHSVHGQPHAGGAVFLTETLHGSKAASAIGKRSDGDAMHTAKAAASAADEVLQEGDGEVSQARLNKW